MNRTTTAWLGALVLACSPGGSRDAVPVPEAAAPVPAPPGPAAPQLGAFVDRDVVHPLGPDLIAYVRDGIVSVRATVRVLPDGAPIPTAAELAPGISGAAVVVHVAPPVPPEPPSLDPRFLPMELALTVTDASGATHAITPVPFHWGIEPPIVRGAFPTAALTLGPDGEPVVASAVVLRGAAEAAIEVLAWRDHAWRALEPIPAPLDAKGLSIAPLPGGLVLAHVARAGSAATVRVHRHDGRRWEALPSPVPVAPGAEVSRTSVAADRDGRPVLALDEVESVAGERTRDRLRLLGLDDDRWRDVATPIVGEGADGEACFGEPTLARDAAGRLLLAYQEATCRLDHRPRAGGAYHVRRLEAGTLTELGLLPAAPGVARPVALAAAGTEVVLATRAAVFRSEAGAWRDLGAPWPGVPFTELEGDFACPGLALAGASPVVACEVAAPTITSTALRVRRHDGTRWADAAGFEEVAFLHATPGTQTIAVDAAGGILVLTREGYVVRR